VFIVALISKNDSGKLLRPGELSLAHCGIVVLDEAPEFKTPVLQGLREPLESGDIRINRVHGCVHYPAQAQVFMSMNPCPCGNLGKSGAFCVCSPQLVQRYWAKIGAPVLDRMDIRFALFGASDYVQNLLDINGDGQSLKRMVLRARAGKGGQTLTAEAQVFLAKREGNESLRSRNGLLRLAGTLAAMCKSPGVDVRHLAAAAFLHDKSTLFAGIPVLF